MSTYARGQIVVEVFKQAAADRAHSSMPRTPHAALAPGQGGGSNRLCVGSRSTPSPRQTTP